MTVCWLATATYEDVAALDRRRAVAILPVGATEAHGPHLPLATDVIIARRWRGPAPSGCRGRA